MWEHCETTFTRRLGRLQRQTTQAARWWFPGGRSSRPDSDSILDRSACDNSHNWSRIFVADRIGNVPGIIEHLDFRASIVVTSPFSFIMVFID
jgi:hypothetical protein